jgi:hypothetical protein
MGWAAFWAIFHLVTLFNTPELYSMRVTFLSNIHIIHMYVCMYSYYFRIYHIFLYFHTIVSIHIKYTWVLYICRYKWIQQQVVKAEIRGRLFFKVFGIQSVESLQKYSLHWLLPCFWILISLSESLNSGKSWLLNQRLQFSNRWGLP